MRGIALRWLIPCMRIETEERGNILEQLVGARREDRSTYTHTVCERAEHVS